MQGDPVFVAVVSDGAGSAALSHVTSALACASFIRAVRGLIERGGTAGDVTRDLAIGWLADFRSGVAAAAEAEARPARDYACTILAAVVGDDASAFLQVGDGAIVVSCAAEPDEYFSVFWPQQGEYANQTNFATDEAAEQHLEHLLIDDGWRSVDEVALFTDGLQGIALDFRRRSAFVPFFRGMLAAVRRAEPGFSPTLARSLATFLDTPRVNDRTDDKTLVLASRRITRLAAVAPDHDDAD